MPFAPTRNPGRTVLAFLALAALLGPAAVRVEDQLEVQARILGSESAQVEEALRARFASPFAANALCVLAGAPSPTGPEGRRLLEEVVEALGRSPGVTRTFSWLDRPDPSLLGKDGRSALVVVGLDAPDGRVDRLVPGLRQVGADLERRLAGSAPGLRVLFTGEGAINYDLWRSSSDDVRRAERRTLPLTLALLLLAFGAFLAALVPVAIGALAVGLSLGLVSLLAQRFSLSILAVNVASMLGLALGIDYALLTVSRFREALAEGEPAGEAARTAARHAGATVALSGVPVLVGFLALLAVPLNEMRSAAAGGLVVTLVCVLSSATLLPALLVWLGPKVDAGRIFRPKWGSAVYGRLAEVVVRRPLVTLGLVLPPLLLFCAEARRLSPEIPRGRWLPATTESARAELALEEMGRSGLLHSARVVVDFPEDVQALSREGWRATRQLADQIARDPRVGSVMWLRGLLGERPGEDEADELAAAAFLPAHAKRTFLAEEGDGALLEVVPRAGLDGREPIALVRDLRRMDAAAVSGLAGLRLRVGGLPAFGADYEDALAGRFPLVVLLVVSGTLLTLFVGFRSLLVPLKAVLLNLLSVGAAFAALVLVFQDGWGVRLLGLSAPVDGVFPLVPSLVFCTVFGLSMDYEVFLVARVREERRRGRSEEEAIVQGVAHTGPLITSAAAVMIAVFGAFVLGDFVLMKMLGFALAVAVLVDATLIRMVIGPALLRLAGRHNWWPGG